MCRGKTVDGATPWRARKTRKMKRHQFPPRNGSTGRLPQPGTRVAPSIQGSPSRRRVSAGLLIGQSVFAFLAQPDLDRMVPARGGEALAVGAERHAGDGAGVALEREQFLARRGVPQLDRVVLTCGCEALAVGAE